MATAKAIIGACGFSYDDWVGPFDPPDVKKREVLRAHRAALVVHDLIEDHPRTVTADWTYLRFHGTAAETYHGRYGADLLRPVAERIRTHLGEGRDVYAYFNNDYACHAVFDARTLKGIWSPPDAPGGGAPVPGHRGFAKTKQAGKPRRRAAQWRRMS
ncbi:MAG: DUF72 domain-containing protein [Planctomycetota bacterium]